MVDPRSYWPIRSEEQNLAHQFQTLDLALAPYKAAARDALGDLMVVVDDRAALRVAARWAVFGERPVIIGEYPKELSERWDYLWSSVNRYSEVVKVASGLSWNRYQAAVDLLVNARLIYPDATIHAQVNRAIIASISSTLRQRTNSRA